ncbi:hypothetical protein L226DRAFT_508984 [Lentinus tigrinus ALCF2SS1-7]|uniref:Protein kinase domain-containing protein n=1 Tax=Lentinus tigrinus ALCF2SS1-6 TaxID=1328759 RepID=A0A5C2SE69_9APHY|nr:hypothetical protein L227DRAFT_592651 [Lentinus tigrinus ALCF2SS1-6]RPD74569.1 hypothetical protein L226DRAFT_508984 [Lentinus tigrinus ALCF2SS1-7]
MPLDYGATIRRLEVNFATLSPLETYWVGKQEFFVSQGYTLLPRYRPDWVPSWRRDPAISVLDAHDRHSVPPAQSHLMDATRLSDGKLVMIKKVARGSEEVRISTYLSSEALRGDPRNHCVPVFDVLDDPDDSTVSFLVMAFLRRMDDVDFDTVGTIFDCIGQLLEGLVFLHEHNVAHRDCAYRNVLMDATAMFPQGFHPVADLCLPDDTSKAAPCLPRSTVPVKYYYADFGISTMFAPGDTHRLVTGTHGLDRDVPELSDDLPYNPFKVDVFILGNLIRTFLVEKYTNVNMLAPLVRQMTAHNPQDRPTAAEALKHMRQIMRSVWSLHRLWRAHPRDEFMFARPSFDLIHLLSVAYRSVF